ncbi:conjugal transfer protein TraB [Aminobacter sp. DSM 101952]|uniref:conjugal transfer protein TraB n=1 Tax=Aminobacter sp. DSM 101952 TaxID=2735891 RepID=UPI0006F66376|nr:conjugal transfer protein TraB [Aminobacter sp. DSM 101952]KQU72408.1 conjugal transfer protein TraB [Aminobacter sp. DSM 101952]
MWPAPLLVFGAATIGLVGWSGDVRMLPAAMMFPLLWARSPSRLIAALVSASYFLAASRGLPEGVSTYYATVPWHGVLLWGAASLVFVATHSILWTRSGQWQQTGRYLLASLLMVAPPLGIVGWAHPVTAAGVLFPGGGWWGLGAAVLALAAMTTRRWLPAALILSSLWLLSVAEWKNPTTPSGWAGLDLEYGQRLGRDIGLEHHRELIEKAGAAAAKGARIVLLPENAIGQWTPTVARLWRNETKRIGVKVMAGATIPDGPGYDNAIMVTSGNPATLYRQRMPVPLSMWQPWRVWSDGGGARAHFLANPIVEVDGMLVAPLLCYEQLLVWPIVQSMLGSPDVVVAMANVWWADRTSIVPIQKASTIAWAKLFSKPVVMAFNR